MQDARFKELKICEGYCKIFWNVIYELDTLFICVWVGHCRSKMSTEYEYVVRDDRASSKSNCPDTNNGTVGGSKLHGEGGPFIPKKLYCLGKFVTSKSFTNSLWQKMWLKLAKGKTWILSQMIELIFMYANTNFGRISGDKSFWKLIH